MSVQPARITRRQCLTVGATALGLTLPRLLSAESNSFATQRSPQARSVIILYLSGGPSQLDMWDMKPHASEEIRGSFKPVGTSVAGIQICEHLPRMARWAHKYTIVRSMSHNESDHLRAGHWIMTGGKLNRAITAFSGLDRNDYPHLGATIAHQLPTPGLPPFVVSDAQSLEQLQRRRELLDQLENSSPFAHHYANRNIEAYRDAALDLVTSRAAKKAFDVTAESDKTRDRYGRHIFGQSTLIARRLVEAGVRLVQVNFIRHDNGKGGQGYDSHGVPPSPPHLQWAKDTLLPPTDAAFAALIEDLSDREMLNETLVVMMGEFGRTPKFNANGGRDHWPGCYSLVVAGGGLTAGTVYGQSDSIAATPLTDAVGPNDLLATIHHQLGIDHRQRIYDLAHRPHPIADGHPITGLIA